MKLPPPSVCQKILKLFALVGSNKGEAENARAKLVKLLEKHGLTWNDLPEILAAARADAGQAPPRRRLRQRLMRQPLTCSRSSCT
jgi:hypothetical protein